MTPEEHKKVSVLASDIGEIIDAQGADCPEIILALCTVLVSTIHSYIKDDVHEEAVNRFANLARMLLSAKSAAKTRKE